MICLPRLASVLARAAGLCLAAAPLTGGCVSSAPANFKEVRAVAVSPGVRLAPQAAAQQVRVTAENGHITVVRSTDSTTSVAATRRQLAPRIVPSSTSSPGSVLGSRKPPPP